MLHPSKCVNLQHWSAEDLTLFLNKVRAAKDKGSFESYTDKPLQESVGLLFFEPSTRTRISFEKAVHHLGGHSMVMGRNDSSLTKGETVMDTFNALYAMGIRTFVYRDQSNAIEEVSQQVKQDVVLVNAGSGVDHHPTQGLLDAYTLWESFNEDFQNKKIVIVGNISHSRVARSNIQWMNKLGIVPTVSGPAQWLEGLDEYSVHREPDFQKAVVDADAVMTLRIQIERMTAPETTVQNYHQRYGVDVQKLRLAKKNVRILHPGPVNHGVELAQELTNHPGNLILKQVHNGVWVRMVLLDQLHQARGTSK